jgi:hypothetical protein
MKEPPTHSDASHRVLYVSTAAEGRLCPSPPLATFVGGGKQKLTAGRRVHLFVIASEAKQSSAERPFWIASSLRSSQ